MNVEEIVTQYAQQLASGEIEYSELDELLKQHNLDAIKVTETKTLIDDKAQIIILNRSENKVKKQQYIQGLILLFLGAGITIASFLGLGVFSSTKVYIISTGMMGFGGFSIFKSKKEEEIRDPKKRLKRYFEKK